jgi:hypothetical protein
LFIGVVHEMELPKDANVEPPKTLVQAFGGFVVADFKF